MVSLRRSSWISSGVDALPRENFHPVYNDGMWRRWRRQHLEYIDQLLPTINEIPSTMLKELSQVAIIYEPAVVGQIALDLFADAASSSRAEEELETAGLFFGCLIKDVCGKLQAKSTNGNARAHDTVVTGHAAAHFQRSGMRLWPAHWFRELTCKGDIHDKGERVHVLSR